ncbi:MAG: SDR family oxidoreductase [Victivallales bacterium]|nr:SDR family oxidoreductase [Victivallales bacterium]
MTRRPAELAKIAEISREYGSNPDFVFLGGGNTSYKTKDYLYIKPSGVSLSTIEPDQFLCMDRETLQQIYELPKDLDSDIREALVVDLQLEATRPAGAGRPSVEAPVHDLIPYKFVVHTHPALVNGMTCAKKGAEAAARLFPQALWLNYCDPGSTLAGVVRKGMNAYKKANGTYPKIIFLQKHGVFVAADTCAEIRKIYTGMMKTLKAEYAKAGCSPDDFSMGEVPIEVIKKTAPQLRTAMMDGEANRATVKYLGSRHAFGGPLTPDHIVYAKTFPFVGEADLGASIEFERKRGYMPRAVEVPGRGLYAVGKSLHDVRSYAVAIENACKIEYLTKAFGGPNYLTKREYSFIENWEVESYRSSVNASYQRNYRLANRICVITGGAQGFGYGIAECMLEEGCIVVIADMNEKQGLEAVKTLTLDYGKNRVFYVPVNIADEASVEAMIKAVTLEVGGIDIFVANAGVVGKSDPLTAQTYANFKFVTDINYLGYFLCVKYASEVMANQCVDEESPWTDIVQVNSKSGLEGSNRNGAYAGSKFGSIGLTQSFALELVSSHIKVNCVCPGNYLDGPLWSDPDKGLFVNYLRSGKVPGAKTVEDVRKFYMAKVPMNRGCLPSDVARAIVYCAEQTYETGQAIPVTGGQVMLN